MRRLFKWTGIVVGFVLLAFVVAAVVTMRRGDRALWPPAPGVARVAIYVVSHGYHAGLVVPRAQMAEAASTHGLGALGVVAQRFSAFPWLEIGWGDEGFYREVPTVAALTIRGALRALFRPGNASVLHVVGLHTAPREVFPDAAIAQLDLSEAGFQRIAGKIDATFARAAGSLLPEELGRGLYGPSLFYRALGTFNIFNVCNHWVADALDAAGVPTAPLLATLPTGLMWDLRLRSGIPFAERRAVN